LILKRTTMRALRGSSSADLPSVAAAKKMLVSDLCKVLRSHHIDPEAFGSFLSIYRDPGFPD
jgi:hypothetical protein